LRFTEWYREIETLGQKAKSLLVDEEVLTESIKIGEDTYVVFLGDDVRLTKNGEKSVYFTDLYGQAYHGGSSLPVRPKLKPLRTQGQVD